ncbi:hypothetical protein [Streptomyces mirabilis]
MTVNQSPCEYLGRLYTVYFLETHVTRDAQGTLTWGGQRVNLAVVTQEHADDVRVVNNPAFNPNSANDDCRSRRALGIRLGNTIYYNIHARGASEYQQLLAAVRRDVPAGLNYVILGDFNRNIRFQRTATARITAGAAANEYLARPNQATHLGGTELGYALVHGTPNMMARVPNGRGADHIPVEFNAPGRPVPPPPNRLASTSPVAYVNVATGSAMDVPADNSGRVITHPQRFNTAALRGHWYAFLHGASGNQRGNAGTRAAADKEGRPGTNPFDQFRIDLASCGSTTALWLPESPAALDDENSGGVESGLVRWRDALRPSPAVPAACPWRSGSEIRQRGLLSRLGIGLGRC